MTEARDELIATLLKDLVGPQKGPDEEISARPTDQYMIGILSPRSSGRDDGEASPEDDEDKDGAEDAEGSPGDAVSMAAQRKPSSMGLSFSIEGGATKLAVNGEAASYVQRWRTDSGLSEKEGTRDQERWIRRPVSLTTELPLEEGVKEHPGPAGLSWCVRALRSNRGGGGWQVTVVLTNVMTPGKGRASFEAASFLQVWFAVRPVGARVVPREVPRPVTNDRDAETNDLIYRDVREWAVGHHCGATWDEKNACVEEVRTTWLPSQLVPSMNEAGHELFRQASRERSGSDDGAFEASRLAAASAPELTRLLGAVPAAYSRWIDLQRDKVKRLVTAGSLSPARAATAAAQLETAVATRDRMLQGIASLEADASARRAFQLAQEAMVLQRTWADGKALRWRPFQLGFQLLNLSGLVAPRTADGQVASDRSTMDLLWFPTGGGKTEAYLALIAFVLFHRRLRMARADDGGGVAVLMRYTLRLLTIQQFERASRLVLACEFLRKKALGRKDLTLGENEPFSIGLWVGSDASPNTVAVARGKDAAKAKQLARCPVCNRDELLWDAERDSGGPYVVRCQGAGCGTGGKDLPVLTIDELIYQAPPSLLIGTIDKFAQIVRREDTRAIFGGGSVPPPELIIQDELHLISGPLGTLAGIYEAAIDQICSRSGTPPKIIGSTATIRRAEDQVRSLFDRAVAQFPPPVLDSTDSCFAVVDQSKPGRLYVGVSTAGRSPKFVLQGVCGSLMQGTSELPDAQKDPYWTLVAYFNSLRELGGALVMMYDDVRDSIGIYAGHHGAPERNVDEEPLELTSRVNSEDIPGQLKQLEVAYPAQNIAAVLATNMMSVGVDIPRLGLMVVNGQPKSMSEYIQASSRVGRQNVPGLIVTVYNAGRPRDRSHFEAFRTWHQALYREVEATSVTPFAPRARDRALHAAVVALARHLVSGLASKPDLDPVTRKQLQKHVELLVARARNIDHDEEPQVRAQATAFLDSWQARTGALKGYWIPRKHSQSLLASLEEVANHKARHGPWSKDAKPTPNSMREVEPSVEVELIAGFAPGGPRQRSAGTDAANPDADSSSTAAASSSAAPEGKRARTAQGGTKSKGVRS